MNDIRSLAGLRHNPARLGLHFRRRCCGRARRRRSGRTHHTGRGRCRCASGGRRTHDNRRRRRRGPVRKLSLTLCFLLAGQDRLHYIPGLGDVREVDLGLVFFITGAGRTRSLRTGAALDKATNPFRLACFNGARVGLAFGESQSCQSIENLLTFDFQLTRQIVNSNLTHPPLFVVLPYASVNWS